MVLTTKSCTTSEPITYWNSQCRLCKGQVALEFRFDKQNWPLELTGWLSFTQAA